MINKSRTILVLLWFALCSLASAQARRVVVIKLDGVPAGLLEEVLHEKDPLTGKSRLPWIDEVFARRGVRLANFYVRGISLSAPSWAMLDTGRHQRIHGNVEYDRLTLITYDYLNFFPFYFGAAGGRSADMPGVEVLDASGVPLVVDRFPWDAKYQGFQLFQRGVRWKTLQHSLQNRFFSRSARELFDELQTGFEFAISIGEQSERELIERLADNHYQYLDYFSGDFDHLAHLTNDRAAQVAELRRIDATVGRIWTAIQNSPMAGQTVLAVVSDHGINSTPGTYSQGYSFVDWFRSAAGGGHHVVTDRYPLTEFRIKGVNPFTSEVITPSRESPYLKDEVQQYPTVFLDLDGNERAAVQFRNSDLNTLHLLLKQMARKDFPARLRGAASETFFDVLDSRRELWSRNLAELQEELGAVRRAIESERAGFVKRKWTSEERVEGLNQPSLRRTAQRILWEEDEKLYREYARVMANLLALRRGPIDPHVRIEELIPKRSLGEPNTIFDLQNYTVGPSREGLVASESGEKLDQVESFRHMNYLSALQGITVRNNVQKTVGARPVDFLAARVPQGILVYADEEHQAVVLNRQNEAGQLELRYVPVGALRATGDGAVSWTEGPWKADLPLRIWEDADLHLPAAVERETWLSGWHTDREWLEATCRTRYSNGIVGVHEQFVEAEPLAPPHSDASEADSKLLMRFAARRRRLVEPELMIMANDHWNFNIRSFNPGGNHGSFLQISTHSVLMFAGGAETGIPQAMVVQTPYDSLSFAPTLLKLAGRDITGLPGPLITEVQRR